MSKILATNGNRTRLMGLEELRQNPDWRRVTDKDQEKDVVKEPRPSGPKEVRTAESAQEKPKAAKTPEEVQANADANAQAVPEANASASNLADGGEEGAGSNGGDDGANGTEAQVSAAPENLGKLIAKIKAAKTPEEVDKLVGDDKRKTIIDMASKHKKNLAK